MLIDDDYLSRYEPGDEQMIEKQQQGGGGGEAALSHDSASSPEFSL